MCRVIWPMIRTFAVVMWTEIARTRPLLCRYAVCEDKYGSSEIHLLPNNFDAVN